MRKGRHRRFEEARALKRSNEPIIEPCPECGAGPEDDHASWCLATEDELEPDFGPVPEAGGSLDGGLSGSVDGTADGGPSAGPTSAGQPPAPPPAP